MIPNLKLILWYHDRIGYASVVVTFGSLWCHSHDLKLGINSFNYTLQKTMRRSNHLSMPWSDINNPGNWDLKRISISSFCSLPPRVLHTTHYLYYLTNVLLHTASVVGHPLLGCIVYGPVIEPFSGYLFVFVFFIICISLCFRWDSRMFLVHDSLPSTKLSSTDQR